jgi:ribosomal protein S12 methylthiotransferase
MCKEQIQNPVIGIASCCDGEFNRPAAELMVGLFHQAGFKTTEQISKADAIVVNTCAFLENGEERTGQIINEIRDNKKPDAKLYASGCLVAKYGTEQIGAILPDFKRFYGNHDEVNIVRDIVGDFNVPIDNSAIPNPIVCTTKQTGAHSQNKCVKDCPACTTKLFPSPNRELCYPQEASSLPVSDGCDHPCTYCNLPLYRGNLRSRSLDDINKELTVLVNQGVTKISLSGLETTSYGQDLANGTDITDVIEMVNQNPSVSELGLFLAHPAGFTEKLLQTIKNTPKIDRLEIPIQHVNDEILKAMNRQVTKEQLVNLLTRLKTDRPDIKIFTTFIVGFPGETEEAFQELVEFLDENWFEEFGAFAYSPETNTQAAHFENQVPRNIRNQRRLFIQERFPQKGWAMLNEVSGESNLIERLQSRADAVFRTDSPYLLALHNKAGRKDLILNPMTHRNISEIWNQLFESIEKDPDDIDWVMQYIRENFTEQHIHDCVQEFSELETDEKLMEFNREHVDAIREITTRLVG